MINMGSSGTGVFFNALENLVFSIQEKKDDQQAL
jgi:hypothetical protein